jgi:hypothetical protein
MSEQPIDHDPHSDPLASGRKRRKLNDGTETAPIVEKKKKLSKLQLECLAKGREIRLEKLKKASSKNK